MIRMVDVAKKFGKKAVLEQININIDAGATALLGPNGAGKTTLMRILVGLYPADEGQIITEGIRGIGYLPQKFGAFAELSIDEMLRYFAALKKVNKCDIDEEIDRVLAFVNLADRKQDRIKTLSGGMVRRVGIAQTILGDSDLLVFDEPTAGLDPEERLRFKTGVLSLKEKKTVLISTHIVEDIESLCDSIIVMNRGHVLFSGSQAELKAQSDNKVYKVFANQKNRLPENSYVASVGEENGEDILVVLSNTKIPQAIVAEPSLQYGYMCLLHLKC